MYFYHPDFTKNTITRPFSEHFISMRPRANEEVFCTDLKGQWGKFKILSCDKKSGQVQLEPIEINKANNPLSKVLFQAIPDKVYMEKLFELLPLTQVSELFLFFGDRSVQYDLPMDRLRKILIRSSEQSQTCFLPFITILKTKKELQETLEKYQPTLLACEENLELSTDSKNLDNSSKTSNPNSCLVGPEGGWSKDELKIFQNTLGLPTASLGDQIYPAWLAGFRFFGTTQTSH